MDKRLRETALPYVGLLLGAAFVAKRTVVSRRQRSHRSPDPVVSVPPRNRPRPVSDVGTIALKYVALAAAVGALVFVMKALLMVGFDLQATAALVASASASTAIQMLVGVTPGVGLVLSLIVAYQLGRMTKPENPEYNTHSASFVLPLLALIVALLSPALMQFPVDFWWGGMLLVVAAVYAFIAGRSLLGWGYITVIFGLGVIVVLQSVFSGSMWLPKERVTVSGREYLVYVTSESDSSLVAYLPANRAVLRLDKSKVDARQYCGTSDPTPTLGAAWKGSPVLPPCPNADVPFPVR